MLVAALSITGVGVVLLALGNAVPLLRAHVKQEIDQEDPYGIIVCEDMGTTYFNEWHLFSPRIWESKKITTFGYALLHPPLPSTGES